MKKLSIRQFVAGMTLIPMLTMTVSLEAYFLQDRSEHLDHDFVERARLIARQFASSSEYGVFSGNQPFLQNIAQGVLQQPDVRGVMVLDAASESLLEMGDFSREPWGATSDANQAMPDHPGPASRSPPGKADVLVDLHIPIVNRGDSLWIYQPIVPVQVALDELGGQAVVKPIGAVILKMSRAHTNQLESQMIWVMVAVTALFLSISIFLAYLVSRRIATPIRTLSDAVQRIGSGHLETRVFVPERVTELGNMAHGINAMPRSCKKRA